MMTAMDVGRFADRKYVKIFFDRKFAAYTGIGVFISALNIALLTITIDVFHVPAFIASTVIIGGTFILRYLLFSIFKVV